MNQTNKDELNSSQQARVQTVATPATEGASRCLKVQFHTCISEPLDRPRALASSVVKPLFSVLRTVANRKWKEEENN